MIKSLESVLRLFMRKLFINICLLVTVTFGQQINISKIESMPNIPSPYLMRNWKNVALGYDSLIFDLNRTGQYLPLINLNENTVNYTNHNSFRLHSYVGTNSPNGSEAINLLPALVGASLCGVDKSNQFGYNWVLMSEEYFNKKNGELVYLNSPSSSSGDDWWYETMPNVFFYQLYDLYPNTGDFKFQFTSVAERWLAAVNKMGAKETPWYNPEMNYRAWNLVEMEPLDSDVREPEAAGAIAWILYNAFLETGNDKFRIGAEHSLEFLNSLSYNPSYEIQLPYGAYIAARMNAELGTNYNIEKIINWCFSNYQNRNWGTITGTWGGNDVDGLIGEVNGSNDYAFLMNTFEQVGALAPLVKYDDRFARAIGKWVLNAANASRLFYQKYLPDYKQDSEEWAKLYDPDSYIAHEALRQTQYAASPYATGDAIDGGWAATNLSLYTSSHVGILGGIIDTTNVEKILRLDVNKTDFFSNDSYQAFLYFNPHETEKLVEIEVGDTQKNIYDAVSNRFILTNQTGKVQIPIPANEAVLVVITPAAGIVTYNNNKTLIDGIVVDYNSGKTIANHPPRIKSVSPEKDTVTLGESIKIYFNAEDIDGDSLSYAWPTVTGGVLTGTGNVVTWTAPQSKGNYIIYCYVFDEQYNISADTVCINVTERINNSPSINKIKASPRKLDLNGETQLICYASDADGDKLNYYWMADSGTLTYNDSVATWTAPDFSGNFYIRCKVTDGFGGEDEDSIAVEVRDFSVAQTGNLIMYLPFNGNTADESGNNNNGTNHGATSSTDYFGNLNRAYSFNGTDQYISVTNNTSLNFQNGISVCFWMKIAQFYDREAYPISHGNWENRWKISITNKKLRWTVKTNSGVKDLDSETELLLNKFYYVTCLYNGADYELYLNGELDAFTSLSGSINQTTYDLTIGQVLPNNKNYNFKGLLDEIRLYDYGLSYPQILELYNSVSPVEEKNDLTIPKENYLYQNYPNPFNPTTNFKWQITKSSHVTLTVFDVLGNKVATLVNEYKPAGKYNLKWSIDNNYTSGIYFYKLTTDTYSETKKFLILK
ncbi:MAG: T9SS C-terminal target domain-containing protein [Ignavibacteriales bacterium]|nr:MAG: T9SS C-terminal target domain-containing protein [Ignavibacteriales bacterium]